MTKAFCAECGYELQPAPARFDGEPAIVGYLPCPKHPSTKVRYEHLGVIHNGMSHLVDDIAAKLKAY